MRPVHAGRCKVCGSPCKRWGDAKAPNKTCSRACNRKMMSAITKQRRRDRPDGMSESQADRYLELICEADACPKHDRWLWLSRAKSFRESVTRSRYID